MRDSAINPSQESNPDRIGAGIPRSSAILGFHDVGPAEGNVFVKGSGETLGGGSVRINYWDIDVGANGYWYHVFPEGNWPITVSQSPDCDNGYMYLPKSGNIAITSLTEARFDAELVRKSAQCLFMPAVLAK